MSLARTFSLPRGSSPNEARTSPSAAAAASELEQNKNNKRNASSPEGCNVNMNSDNTNNNKNASAANEEKDDSSAQEKEVFVTMNNPLENAQHDFPNNFVKTYKYEWYTFLFLNLLYQFLKVSNFFFLLNAIYSLIPDVSPFSPIVSIAPLLFVVGVAMLKDGVEDVYRHIADAQANRIVAHVVRLFTAEQREKVILKEQKEAEERARIRNIDNNNQDGASCPVSHSGLTHKTAGLNLETKVMTKGPNGEDIEMFYRLVDVESRDVQVGDIMMIKNGEEIRADVLLLSSTGTEGGSFIDTCNLDGETNLKSRKAVHETWYIKDVESAVRATRNLRIKTTEPSPHLLHWGAVVTIEKEEEEENNKHKKNNITEVAVGLEQFLYRSSVLKNTELAWGVVVYAGVDTKMFRNLEDRPPKRSNLDVKLNWLIAGVVGVMHVILLFQSGFGVHFNNAVIKDRGHWYAKGYAKLESDGTFSGNFVLWGRRYLAYFILMSYMIPISLFVTIELCKVAQAKLMEWDHEMFEWMHGKWQHCTANTSNLNEQLSQVKFIFSDKTGTLTENVMKFKLGDVLGLAIDSDNWANSRRFLYESSQDPNNTQQLSAQLLDAGAKMSSSENNNVTPAIKCARMHRYMLALALCHTVQPFEDEDSESGIKLDGPSPDELALVDAAKQHGYELRDRMTRFIKLVIDPNNDYLQQQKKTPENETTPTTDFEILATLEFTPDRKMMSIVVRNPINNKIELYTKGADSFVMNRLNPDRSVNSEADINHTVESLHVMALTGLRTLMICYRELPSKEFDAWHANFVEAGKALRDRSKIVDRVCLELEKDLQLVGVTAIEDKLQDQVPETIKFLLDAGIIVWMLTGDRRETAVTIGETSKLANGKKDHVDHIDIGSLKGTDPAAVDIVRKQLEIVREHIKERDAKNEGGENGDDDDERDAGAKAETSMKETGDESDSSDDGECGTEMKTTNAGDERKKVTFVIDGPALQIAMSQELSPLFIEVSMKVNSAICCRLTPIQKANVVRMFQQQTGTTALAIGDGANDVSMIAEGRVGVGIIGLEGAQAALAADYAIPRFKHLKRLLAVHGRYALVRNATCIIFSFYKNFLLSTTLALYSFYSGLSGISIYDGWLLTMYNIILTSLPPGAAGFFEKDAPEHLLEQNPFLYKKLQRGLYFSGGQLVVWFSEAVVHGIVIFYMMFPMMLDQDVDDGQHGRKANLITISSIMNSVIVVMVLCKLGLHVRYWQVIYILAFAASIFIYFIFMVIYSSFTILDNSSVFYNVASLIWNEPKFWLYVILAVFGILGVDAGVIALDRHVFHPSLINKDEDRVEQDCRKKLEAKQHLRNLNKNNNKNENNIQNVGGPLHDSTVSTHNNSDSQAIRDAEERRARVLTDDEKDASLSSMKNVLAIVPPQNNNNSENNNRDVHAQNNKNNNHNQRQSPAIGAVAAANGSSSSDFQRRHRSNSNSFAASNHLQRDSSRADSSNSSPATFGGAGIVTNQQLQQIQHNAIGNHQPAINISPKKVQNSPHRHNSLNAVTNINVNNKGAAAATAGTTSPRTGKSTSGDTNDNNAEAEYDEEGIIQLETAQDQASNFPSNRVSPVPGFIASSSVSEHPASLDSTQNKFGLVGIGGTKTNTQQNNNNDDDDKNENGKRQNEQRRDADGFPMGESISTK